MDQRINQVSAWYNQQLERHRGDKREFEHRFKGAEGKYDLDNPDIARGFGRLEKEHELLDGISSILKGEFVVEDVTLTDTDIDKT